MAARLVRDQAQRVVERRRRDRAAAAAHRVDRVDRHVPGIQRLPHLRVVARIRRVAAELPDVAEAETEHDQVLAARDSRGRLSDQFQRLLQLAAAPGELLPRRQVGEEGRRVRIELGIRPRYPAFDVSLARRGGIHRRQDLGAVAGEVEVDLEPSLVGENGHLVVGLQLLLDPPLQPARVVHLGTCQLRRLHPLVVEHENEVAVRARRAAAARRRELARSAVERGARDFLLLAVVENDEVLGVQALDHIALAVSDQNVEQHFGHADAFVQADVPRRSWRGRGLGSARLLRLRSRRRRGSTFRHGRHRGFRCRRRGRFHRGRRGRLGRLGGLRRHDNGAHGPAPLPPLLLQPLLFLRSASRCLLLRLPLLLLVVLDRSLDANRVIRGNGEPETGRQQEGTARQRASKRQSSSNRRKSLHSRRPPVFLTTGREVAATARESDASAILATSVASLLFHYRQVLVH